jgi:hypothetical protein
MKDAPSSEKPERKRPDPPMPATEGPILTTPITLYREERLARFRRCCRFRSFHLAFWLLLSFARAALVHLNAIVYPFSVERPGPPLMRRAGTCHNVGSSQRHDH